MFALTSQMRVHGLKRKSKNGTAFYIEAVTPRHSEFERGKHFVQPKGYATVLKTSKDGLVTATLDATGETFTFHTTNKTIWPDAKVTK